MVVDTQRNMKCFIHTVYMYRPTCSLFAGACVVMTDMHLWSSIPYMYKVMYILTELQPYMICLLTGRDYNFKVAKICSEQTSIRGNCFTDVCYFQVIKFMHYLCHLRSPYKEPTQA